MGYLVCFLGPGHRFCFGRGSDVSSMFWICVVQGYKMNKKVDLSVWGMWSGEKKETRRERLKSALYLRLKKRKVFKPVKGGPFGLFKNPVCCKIPNKLKVGPFEGKKIEKSRTVPKKIENRGSFSLVRFRKCSKKFLAKARSQTRDRWVHRKPSKLCTKKWYIHDEVCGLTKKKEKQDGNV